MIASIAAVAAYPAYGPGVLDTARAISHYVTWQIASSPTIDKEVRLIELASSGAPLDEQVLTVRDRVVSFREPASRLDHPLVIPRGYTLVLEPGTSIDLVSHARIVSFSPVHASGSAARPIRIHSSDGQGQGILVFAAAPSYLDHVIVENLGPPAEGTWSLSGAVSFYRSDVHLSHCRFARARAEDGLHVVRSKYDIRHCEFVDNPSDGVDVDFGSGTIAESMFRDNGNDGLDVSASEVRLTAIGVEGAGDKGVSIGEESRCEADGLDVHDAFLGIAIKDLSDARIRDARIQGGPYGVALFQTRPAFGGATATVDRLDFKEVNAPLLVEHDSRLIVQGRSVTHRVDAVMRRLYPTGPGVDR